MKKRKSRKKDLDLVAILAAKARKTAAHQSSQPLLEQVLETMLGEREKDAEAALKAMARLLKEFVDWNEVRIVSQDRLLPFLEDLWGGAYKAKVVQAFLHKIFSRSGSLDVQFMLDLEQEALEDYLAGIMEMREGTRKILLLRIFHKQVLPFTMDHELIFERVGTNFVFGDEEMKGLFAPFDTGALEGILHLLDGILEKHCKEKPACSGCALKPVCIHADEKDLKKS